MSCIAKCTRMHMFPRCARGAYCGGYKEPCRGGSEKTLANHRLRFPLTAGRIATFRKIVIFSFHIDGLPEQNLRDTEIATAPSREPTRVNAAFLEDKRIPVLLAFKIILHQSTGCPFNPTLTNAPVKLRGCACLPRGNIKPADTR